MASIRELLKEEPKAVNLFLFLTEHMDNSNALIVSKETLSEHMDCSVRTITRQVKILKEKGFLQVLKSGPSNVYCVNANIAWTTSGSKREYARFRAEVLISRSEQQDLKESKIKQLNLIEE